MIQVDYQNVLSDKIGLLNGISKRVFERSLNKYYPLVKQVFRSNNKFGYAFLNLPDDVGLVRKIKKFAEGQKRNKWENVVVLGIGGSALGGIALQDAVLGPLHHLGKKPHLFFVDNIDPCYVTQLLTSIELKKSLFIVISKSGGTVEPMALLNLIKLKLVKAGTDWQKHMIFITDANEGELRPIGKREKITMFEVPSKVGGRFSVLSSVGLVPTALADMDIGAVLRGAKKMREEIKKSKPENNPALILAFLQYFLDKRRKKSMTVMMPYSNLLFRFGDWYRQLLAESIGKNKKTGPTPINALGVTDQHSQLQLYNEGPNNKFLIFLHVLKHREDIEIGSDLPKNLAHINNKKMSEIINAALMGTAQSLTKNKRPNITINISKINEESIGALFMLFEFQVALLGLLYKVDAFNQPGVEAGKVITKEILSQVR